MMKSAYPCQFMHSPKGAFRVNAPLFCVPSWDGLKIVCKKLVEPIFYHRTKSGLVFNYADYQLKASLGDMN